MKLTKPAFGKRDKALAAIVLNHMRNANPPTVLLWTPGLKHALRHVHADHDAGAWEPSLKQRRPQPSRHVGPMTAGEIEANWAAMLRHGGMVRVEHIPATDMRERFDPMATGPSISGLKL